MPSKSQRIRDPLYNLIEFNSTGLSNDEAETENTIWNLIQTSEFQRLRRIKQLGFSDFVYPGATHTRFSHSLGVFHVARRLINLIKKQNMDHNSNDRNAALVASLLHDIGHGPFSHAWEDVGKRLNLVRATNHELISRDIICSGEISEVLRGQHPHFHEDVANAIGEHNNIYSSVVSGQFDADRLDYMQRDRLMTGTYIGTVDLEWLLSNLEIGEIQIGVEDKAAFKAKTLVINAKAIYAAEAYVLNLFQLYPTVYLHKTTRCAEKIFTELMVLVINEIKKSGSSSLNINDKHPLMKFAQDTGKLDNILSLDDTVIWGTLYLLKDANDYNIKNLATRLIDRKLFKSSKIDIKQKILDKLKTNKQFIPEMEPLLLNKAYATLQEKIDDWNASQTSVDDFILFDLATRSPYKQYLENTETLDQIWVKNGNDICTLDKQSEMVRGLPLFVLPRAYLSSNNNKAEKHLERLLDNI